jgi:hypothetical protein
VQTTENPIAVHRSRPFLVHLNDPFGRSHVNVQRRNLDAAWVTTAPTGGDIILYCEGKEGGGETVDDELKRMIGQSIAEFAAFQGLFLEIESARLQHKKKYEGCPESIQPF